jgi:hypothetical protein
MPQSTYSQGPHAIRILRQQAASTLAPGTYRIVLASHKLAKTSAVMLVVQ